MSTNTEVKKAMLSPDNILVDENNIEIPLDSIRHCLGSLFQVTNSGLRHLIVLQKQAHLVVCIALNLQNKYHYPSSFLQYGTSLKRKLST